LPIASFEYRPRISEEEYLSQSITQTLAGASSIARQGALARLIGELDDDELSGLRELAEEMNTRRR
jgi:predicted transcriptional regulator